MYSFYTFSEDKYNLSSNFMAGAHNKQKLSLRTFPHGCGASEDLGPKRELLLLERVTRLELATFSLGS